jgi:hypothetical protein
MQVGKRLLLQQQKLGSREEGNNNNKQREKCKTWMIIRFVEFVLLE